MYKNISYKIMSQRVSVKNGLWDTFARVSVKNALSDTFARVSVKNALSDTFARVGVKNARKDTFVWIVQILFIFFSYFYYP